MRFDLVETALIVGVAVAATAVISVRAVLRPPSAEPEYTWFERTYGPDKQSEYAEEWILEDYFRERRGGVFVDVGAHDPRQLSNTYALEHERGWTGLAIDANPEFADAYRQQRPRTRFLAFFVADVSHSTATLYVPDRNTRVASATKDFADRYDKTGRATTVPTITLDDLLDQAGIRTFDFLTMDIELAEPKALAGFDIDRFRPELVCIEGHAEVRQAILDYFAGHGYRLIGRYLRADASNLWYLRGDVPMPTGLDVYAAH